MLSPCKCAKSETSLQLLLVPEVDSPKTCEYSHGCSNEPCVAIATDNKFLTKKKPIATEFCCFSNDKDVDIAMNCVLL